MAINKEAVKAGLYKGMGLSDARAIIKDLVIADADPDQDQRALIRLAHWARRWCPWVSPLDNDGTPFAPDQDSQLVAHGDAYGLMLDITGSAHLLGGERALAKDVARRFGRAGYATRIAIADTVGAAYALARFAAKIPYRSTTDSLLKDLAPLPVEALRLRGDMLHSLYRLGLKTIGAITPLPRASLARRFRSKSAKQGAAFAHLLTQIDRILGHHRDPLTPLTEPADFSVRLPLMEPLFHADLLMTVISDGLDTLLAQLEEQALGVRALTMTGFRLDGSLAQVSVSCASASLDKAHLLRLFKDRVEQIDAGFGIEIVLLTADRTATLVRDQRSTLDTNATDPKLLDQLADRLSAKLGGHAVTRLAHQASWAPERAQTFRPFKASAAVSGADTLSDRSDFKDMPSRPPRPARLLLRPEPVEVLAEVPDGPPLRFRWRRQMLDVAAAEGPERIAPEWWLSIESPRNEDTASLLQDDPRDYFRTQTSDGQRLWLYRRGLYPHRAGLETLASDQPRWFVHGLFA